MQIRIKGFLIDFVADEDVTLQTNVPCNIIIETPDSLPSADGDSLKVGVWTYDEAVGCINANVHRSNGESVLKVKMPVVRVE